MVVAAAAFEGQTKYGGREHIQRFIDHFISLLDAILVEIRVIIDVSQKTSGDQQ